jgi:hypothetical protein
MPPTEEISPADLRALRARTQEPVYLLAARLRVHPGRLSMYLRGTLPMPAGLAQRIAAALKREREAAAAG